MRDDLKTAFRSLRKSPTFTAVALVVLALGIGAGTAIFSVVDAVVLRGLPFDEHDRLAVILEHDTTRPTTFGSGLTTPQMYLDWRNLNESFEGIAAVGGWSFRLRNENGEPAVARGQTVTSEFFPVLRVSPLLGRSFTRDDEIRGRHRVVILGHGFWQRRFGGDPDVIGRTIELGEESWEIVGVLPRTFTYPVASARPAEIFCPRDPVLRHLDEINDGEIVTLETAIRAHPWKPSRKPAERAFDRYRSGHARTSRNATKPVAHFVNGFVGNTLMALDVLTRNIRDELLITVPLGIENEKLLAFQPPCAKCSCRQVQAELERHVESRKPRDRPKFNSRQVVNSVHALANQRFDLVETNCA